MNRPDDDALVRAAALAIEDAAGAGPFAEARAALAVFRANDPLLREMRDALEAVVKEYPVSAGNAPSVVYDDDKGYGSIRRAAEVLRKHGMI